MSEVRVYESSIRSPINCQAMPQMGSKLSRIQCKERNMMIHKICKLETEPLVQRSIVFPGPDARDKTLPQGPSKRGIYSFTNRPFSNGLLVISMYSLKVSFLQHSSICSNDSLPKDKSKNEILWLANIQVHLSLSVWCNLE